VGVRYLSTILGCSAPINATRVAVQTDSAQVLQGKCGKGSEEHRRG
jgi:hypothetical protein